MKKLVLAVFVLLIGFGLVWAGGESEASGGSSTSPAQPQRVRIMGYGGQDPAVVTRLLNEVIGADLKAKNIEVVYEPLEGDYNAALFNALSAGTAGDIFYIPVETAPGIIATGKVEALNDYVNPDPFIESLTDAYTIDGKLYGIAKDFNTLALVYNKDLFDEAGVAYPNENDTWETLAQKARKISELGQDVYGIALPADYARFGAFAFGAGWSPFGGSDGRTNLNDPAFVSATSWYTGLVRDKVGVLPSDIGQGWGGGALATENVGMAIEGAWIIGFLRNEAPNLAYGATFLPKAPNTGERGNFLFTVAYGINSDSPRKAAAVEVLKALTSEKAQQFILEEGLAIPSRTALADNPFFDQDTVEAQTNKVVFQGAEEGVVYGYQFGVVGTDWMGPVNAMLSEVMTGQISVNDAVRQAQNELDAILDRAGL
ncbi:ABC transporter substrate-binding protein [Spirochaeta lutea]|uniref:ABC transporter substrate-binding protein n=1 Tax=Spirochaeta lutea TaxID=1480694 RepID=A0A098QYT3_9SPIO|nr:ABC transporter substrate-binding protein [Spirochaeta lutea]KGE72691.1 ABC transporter substrate-binding protein [Spirochaeta lutea]